MVEETCWSNQKTEEEEWRHQTGLQSNEETMVQKIQRCRLQWFRHVKQMDNSRLPAKALSTLYRVQEAREDRE